MDYHGRFGGEDSFRSDYDLSSELTWPDFRDSEAGGFYQHVFVRQQLLPEFGTGSVWV
jgi:hypothetical protein